MKKSLRILVLLVLAMLLAVTPVLAEGITFPLDETVTLNVLTYSGVTASMPEASNDLGFWQWVEEQTNVHIEWEIIASESVGEIINTRLASGEALPDITYVSSASNALAAGQAGMCIDMAPYFEAGYAPYTSAMFETNDFMKNCMVLSDGSIYAFCEEATPIRNQILPMYNKAWLEAVGKEVPTTTEEFLDVCRALKAAGDLNGNGVDDEIILTGPGIYVFDQLSNAFGLQFYEDWDAFNVDENGVVYDEYTSEGMKEFFEYMKVLYDEGILNQSIFAMDWNTFYEDIGADKVAIFWCYTSFSYEMGNMTTAGIENPNSEIYTIGEPLEGPNGDKYIMKRERAMGGQTVVSSACEHPEVAVAWLDYIFCCDDAIWTRYYGIEGEHYTKAEDGTLTPIYPEGVTNYSAMITQWGGGQIPLPHWQHDEWMFAGESMDPTLSWWNDQDLANADYFISASVPHVALSVEEQAEYDVYNSDIKTYFREMQANFVSGKADIETEWQAYDEKMDALGMAQLTAVFQSVYDRTR